MAPSPSPGATATLISALSEPTFSDVIDWLAEREGKSAYIETGMSDPALEGSDSCLLALHEARQASDC